MHVIEVEKAANENTITLLRRFTKRVQGSKILSIVRERKFRNRQLSTLKQKRRALKGIEITKNIEKLKKLGKYVPEKKKGR